MKVNYYIIILFFLLQINTSAEDFISAINNPNIKYEFGHWVIYEMNIGSFTQEGTFAAAAEKLPDLKDLGIDIIWLMPIYVRDGREADHGINSPYAAKDLKNTNPSYGSITDLQNFVNRAHQLYIQVWFDWVAAHTANNNQWLTDHRDYYMENLHGAYLDVSRLNYSNPEVPRVMTSILKYWIDTADIDGFRVDYISNPDVPTEYWTQTIPEIKDYKPGKTITFLGEADFTDQQRFFYTFWDYDYAWGFQAGSLKDDMGNNQLMQVNLDIIAKIL